MGQQSSYVLMENQIFKHWIKSGIVFVGDFCPKVFVHATDIRNQPISKTNYITETYQIRKAIPKIWIKKLAAAELTQFIAPSINEIVLKGDNLHMKPEQIEIQDSV